MKDYQESSDEIIIDSNPNDQEDLSDFKFSKFAATYFTASVMHSYLRKLFFNFSQTESVFRVPIGLRYKILN